MIFLTSKKRMEYIIEFFSYELGGFGRGQSHYTKYSMEQVDSVKKFNNDAK
jgi:hypothetical protein